MGLASLLLERSGLGLDQGRSQREECALTHTSPNFAAYSSTLFLLQSISSCAVLTVELSAFDLFHTAIGASNRQSPTSKLPCHLKLPSVLSYIVTLACWLLFPLTTVYSNGWLSILLTATAPACILMKTLS